MCLIVQNNVKLTEMKKSVLFLMTSFEGGGTEKVLLTMLQNFDYVKYDVTLSIISNIGRYLHELPPQVHQVPIYSSPHTFLSRLGFVLYSRFHSKIIERISTRRAIKDHYDVIVSFCEGRALKFHGYILDKADKNISWVHCDLFNMHYTLGPVLYENDEQKIYEAMDEVIFVSNGARQQFGQLGYKIKHASVIYNPLDTLFIQSYKISHKQSGDYFLVVLCGRLVKAKAYDRMIRVASSLIKEGFKIKVNIIGEGEERNNLSSLISDLDLSEYVSLLGFMNLPFSEMAKADLFVSSSIYEGFGMNLCEALCLGLPIVATRCSGTAEILGENEEFGLIAENNEKSLYECISRILKDKELQLAYRKKSECAILRFDIKKTMKDVYSIL